MIILKIAKGGAGNFGDEMVKHAPDMVETIDSTTQGASVFLDPTGAEVGDKVVGPTGGEELRMRISI